MWEFFEVKILIATILITLFVTRDMKLTGKLLSIFSVIIFFTILIEFKRSIALDNLEAFKNKQTLSCNGLTISSPNYNVSIKNGWSIDGLYFTNSNFRIKADNCNILNKKGK